MNHRIGKPVTRPPLTDGDHYCTPQEFLVRVRRIGPIVLDPCAGPEGWTGASGELRLDRGQDGLTESWAALADGGLIFVNPPYGRGHPPLWAEKVAAEVDLGAEVLALVRGNLGTGWWQDFYAPRIAAFCIPRGRIAFVDPKTMEPEDGGGRFDSMVAYFGDRTHRFRAAFGDLGWVVRP